MDVGQLGVPEESADDAGTFLESFQGLDCDGFEIVSGQGHGSRDPVVLDVLVDPFVRVQSVARAMTETGHRPQAIEVLTDMAEKMQPYLGAEVELISMYGMLLLPAEIAAAKQGDTALASAMHAEAKAVAQQLGPTYTNRITAFGLTNVALHRVAALVRLQEGRAALKFASTITPSEVAKLPAERKANLLMDLASARLQSNAPDKAVYALLEAEKIAPQEVLCRPSTHDLLTHLLSKTSGDPNNHLRGLAKRAGVSV